MGEPALWRQLLAVGLCFGVGLLGGPAFVPIADAAASPVVSMLGGVGVRVREPIAFGAVMALIVTLLGFGIGYVARAGRFVAGWILGFMITESVWRPAIQHALDGGKIDPALEALVTALLLALIAAVAIDAGRRFIRAPRAKS